MYFIYPRLGNHRDMFMLCNNHKTAAGTRTIWSKHSKTNVKSQHAGCWNMFTTLVVSVSWAGVIRLKQFCGETLCSSSFTYRGVSFNKGNFVGCFSDIDLLRNNNDFIYLYLNVNKLNVWMFTCTYMQLNTQRDI